MPNRRGAPPPEDLDEERLDGDDAGRERHVGQSRKEMWTTPQFDKDGNELAVVMSRSGRFTLDSGDRKTHKERLRLRKEASVRLLRADSTQRKESEDSLIQSQAAKLLDQLSDTSQTINHIIEKSAKQAKKGIESEQRTRGKRLPLDKAHTATIQYTNESHHYFLEFPPMPITSMLRIDIKRRITSGSEVHLYVGRDAVPSPAQFEWHCPCESALIIDPEDPAFYHGMYWLTVYSLGKNAEYTIHCRSMVYRDHAGNDHDKTAVKLLAQNIKRRVVKSEEVRAASQKELKHLPSRSSPRNEKTDLAIHQKFQEFEWLQSTMEPYDLKSRAVTVKKYPFNPVRMRDAIIQIQDALAQDSTAKQRYENGAVHSLDVCEMFISETFKAYPRFRPSSAMSRMRSTAPSSPVRPRPSTLTVHKSVVEATKQRPTDRRIVLLQSKGQLPASYLGRLRADADDFRTHSFDRCWFKLTASGAVQQSGSEQEEGETVFEVKEMLAASAVTLPDQPSNFFCFKLNLATSSMTMAAYSQADRDKWLRAALLFLSSEKVSAPHAPASRSPSDKSPTHARHLGQQLASPCPSRVGSPVGKGHVPSRSPGSDNRKLRPPSPASQGTASSAPLPHSPLLPASATLVSGTRHLEPDLSVVDASLYASGSAAAHTVTGAVHPRRPFSADPDEESAGFKHRRPATAMQ